MDTRRITLSANAFQKGEMTEESFRFNVIEAMKERPILCPECGSDKVRCIENGIEIRSHKHTEKVNDESLLMHEVNGDLYVCTECKQRFVTGLGLNSKEWGKQFEEWGWD